MGYPDEQITSATDARVNRIVSPLEHRVSSPDDLQLLRGRWADMESIPKLIANREEGEDTSFGGLDIRTLLRGEESCGRYSVHSIVLKPGTFIPPHSQSIGNSYWWVVRGEVALTIGSRTATVGEKAFGYAPADTTQAIANTSSTLAEVVVAHSPAGVDRAFSAAHMLGGFLPDVEFALFEEVLGDHGIVLTHGQVMANDHRVNADFERVDAPIFEATDYQSLRNRWSDTSPIPKLIVSPKDCRNIAVTDQETRVLTMPEETGGAASAFYGALANGFGAPPHHQPAEEEFFVVLDGPLELHIGEQSVDAAHRGAFAFAPRYTTHAFKSNSDHPITLFTMNSPGGHDRGFELSAGGGGRSSDGGRPAGFMDRIQAHGFIFHQTL